MTAYDCGTDHDDDDVEDGEEDLSGRRKQLSPVEMQPEHAAEAVCMDELAVINNRIASCYLQVNQLANKETWRGILVSRQKASLVCGSVAAYNQTQEVVENGNGFGDDPGDDPDDKDDQDPDADGDEASFAHAIGAAEDAHVDLLGRNVGVDDACNDDLHWCP